MMTRTIVMTDFRRLHMVAFLAIMIHRDLKLASIWKMKLKQASKLVRRSQK